MVFGLRNLRLADQRRLIILDDLQEWGLVGKFPIMQPEECCHSAGDGAVNVALSEEAMAFESARLG